jgi:hypothetical protein
MRVATGALTALMCGLSFFRFFVSFHNMQQWRSRHAGCCSTPRHCPPPGQEGQAGWPLTAGTHVTWDGDGRLSTSKNELSRVGCRCHAYQ